MIKRRKTITINVGGIKIGSAFPVRIQSMVKCPTKDIKAVISEIKTLKKAGCEIVRVAIKDSHDAQSVKLIKKKVGIPIVGDIHYNYRLALDVIGYGADKIRINPGNISKEEELKSIIKVAKKRRIPIRIGINSGSLPRMGYESNRINRTVRFAQRYIRLFEKYTFRDIIVSVKCSDVTETVEANRLLSKDCYYPFHLGITAAGPYDTGIIKSSIGIGALLLEGIGDTVRVSLTGESVSEIYAARKILESLDIRRFGPDIISCPTCGRCQVNMVEIVNELKNRICRRRKLSGLSIKIAVMGCEVNGPGEAKDADIGIAFGRGTGLLFCRGKILKRVNAKSSIKELLNLIDRTISS